ncbi:MAG: thioredoxin family protein [Candidatus Binatia bacterium]
MAFDRDYERPEPTRRDVDAMPGPVVLEFGAAWCGYCQAAQPILAAAFASYPGIRHVKVGDASGRTLGRSFGVKLWPTLVFLKDGKEIARLVRPTAEDDIQRSLEAVGR